MLDVSEQIMKGTTTVGLIFKDGVVLATEMRAMGNPSRANAPKLQNYSKDRYDHCRGVGDAQQLGPIIQVEALRDATRDMSSARIDPASIT